MLDDSLVILRPIAGSFFAAGCSVGVMLPVLPLLATSLSIGPSGYGMVVGAFAGAKMVSNIPTAHVTLTTLVPLTLNSCSRSDVRQVWSEANACLLHRGDWIFNTRDKLRRISRKPCSMSSCHWFWCGGVCNGRNYVRDPPM